MTTAIRILAGTSLKALAQGFVLTKLTEGRSPKTIRFYEENLRRFLWFGNQQGWPDDARLLDEWAIRQFLGYVRTEQRRWGLTGNGSETSRSLVSQCTVRHYFVVLNCFFNWLILEGLMSESPMARVKVARPKQRVIIPYSSEDIQKMLAVCDHDYNHNARQLGSRNRALVLVLLDTGLRLSEVARMSLRDLSDHNGSLRVVGKGNKERMVRMGRVTQKAIWRYMMHRPDNGVQQLWLTEEGSPITTSAIQSLVKRLKQRAGVQGGGGAHRFRHTFALSFLRADKNVFNLQYLLGHNSLEMTRRYTAKLNMEDALRAHEKASPADALGLK